MATITVSIHVRVFCNTDFEITECNIVLQLEHSFVQPCCIEMWLVYLIYIRETVLKTHAVDSFSH